MGDSLTITMPKGIRVDTVELVSQADLLATFGRAVAEWRSRAGSEYAMPVSRNGGITELQRAAVSLERLLWHAGFLRVALRSAAAEYERAEREAAKTAGFAEQFKVWGSVLFRGPTVWASLLRAGFETGSWVVRTLIDIVSGKNPDISEADLMEHVVPLITEWISDPAFVDWLRTAVDAVDDGMAGLFRLPMPVGVGVEETAAVLLLLSPTLLGQFGMKRAFAETEVKVRQVSAEYESPRSMAERAEKDGEAVDPATQESPVPPDETVDPPDSINELLRRIPDSGPGEPQVRVERYEGGWIVYTSGTVEWGVVPEGNPSDLTSAVRAIANQSMIGDESAAAERMVEQALEAAGAKPGDAVITVGHSLGGLVAARVAENHGHDTQAVVTAGAPINTVEVPLGVPVYSIEHDEDLVPALAGHGRPNDAQTIVGRSVLDGEPASEGIPGHDLTIYRETAAIADEDEPASTRETLTALATVTGGGAGTATRWLGERVPPTSPDGR